MSFACLVLSLALTTLEAADSSSAWRLVWSDEFDYEGHPDPAKWDYERGHLRAHERSFLTDRLENVRVTNGHLIIEARKETYANHDYDPASVDWRKAHMWARYTSASIVTKNRPSVDNPQGRWTYGRFEIRARLPKGRGFWPGLWTLGDNAWLPNKESTYTGWPQCGEIDIVEYFATDGSGTKRPEVSRLNEIQGSVHYYEATKGGDNPISGRYRVSDGQQVFCDEFHTYAIEWYPDHIDFHFDDRCYYSINFAEMDFGEKGNPFARPHYLLLSLIVGGDSIGDVDDSVFPQRLEVDYVRVYQLIGS